MATTETAAIIMKGTTEQSKVNVYNTYASTFT